MGNVRRESAVNDESVFVVLRVRKHLCGRVTSDIRGRETRARLVDLEVFTVVWGGADALRQGIARIPVHREVDTGVVGDSGVGNCVLTKTRVGVVANCAALLTIGFLGAQVFGVCGSEDIEAVSVIGCDDD